MEAAEALALLMSPFGRVDPYPLYRELRRHGPVTRVGDDLFVVTGYAAVDGLLRDPRLLVRDAGMLDRQWVGWRANPAVSVIATSVLQTNPPDHARMRRLVAGTFTARRVSALRDVVTAQARELVARIAERGRSGQPVDFLAEFGYPLPVGVICALLGVPAADHPWFRGRAADLTAVLEPEITQPDLDTANRGAVELAAYLRELIGQRRRTPAADLTTALVQAHDNDPGQLSGDELLANLVLLLVAGFETTTNLLGNGLAVLLAHPRHADRLRADESLAPAFVQEMLRFDAPVQLTSRVVGEPTEVAGEKLPAGAEVLLLFGAANRDPERFADPDRFDPGRPDNQPISFGAGAHYCLGAPLARLEAAVAFPELLRGLPALASAGRPTQRVRLTLRGYQRLPVSVA